MADLIKVYNRSDSNITYNLREQRQRRVFALGECKELEPDELNALYQMDGGKTLCEQYLLIDDEAWVKAHFREEPPLEYFWKPEDVKKCLLEDSLDLFQETLEYAPAGVIDLIKMYAWQLPISDLNKIEAIKMATGFDTLAAVEVMSASKPRAATPKKERLRKREG